MKDGASKSTGAKAMFWIGWVISAIPILMMGIAPIFFLAFKRDMIADGMKKYGFPSNTMVPIVITEIACGLIYAFPKTAGLGAILLTGYLGGAVATHVHAGEGPEAVAPILFGVFVWLGLFLRDARVRSLIPWRW